MTDGWRITKITGDHAKAMSTWVYDGLYSFYNGDPDDAEWYLDPENGYVSVVDAQGELVAHICLGFDARVPGGDYEQDAVDIGVGMRPDLTGKGHGRHLVDLAIAEARRHRPDEPLRATIAAFNERSQQVFRKAGFQETQIFRNPAGREFVIFVRD